MFFDILGEIAHIETIATASGIREVARLRRINNEGYATSLERRKIYVARNDPAADKNGLLRIVDESGDDYLLAAA